MQFSLFKHTRLLFNFASALNRVLELNVPAPKLLQPLSLFLTTYPLLLPPSP